ncbi:MAG: hypothetical protein ACYC3X_22915 [Pirellulaceae bacterium]
MFRSRLLTAGTILRRIGWRLQGVDGASSDGHGSSGEIVQLGYRNVSRILLLHELAGGIENDRPQIEFRQGENRGKIHMVIRVLGRVVEVRRVNERDRGCRAFLLRGTESRGCDVAEKTKRAEAGTRSEQESST